MRVPLENKQFTHVSHIDVQILGFLFCSTGQFFSLLILSILITKVLDSC